LKPKPILRIGIKSILRIDIDEHAALASQFLKPNVIQLSRMRQSKKADGIHPLFFGAETPPRNKSRTASKFSGV
jgi:hypothetical protein